MNILKSLNANETAMVTAGQIYWAYLDHKRKRQPRYFVPGRIFAYTDEASAWRYAKKQGLNSYRFYECNTTTEAAQKAARNVGGTLMQDFFKLK